MPQNMSASVDTDHGHSAHSTHSQDDRFSHRDTNVTGSEVCYQDWQYLNLKFDDCLLSIKPKCF